MYTKLIAAALAAFTISTATVQAKPDLSGRYVANNDGHFNFVAGPLAYSEATTHGQKAAHKAKRNRAIATTSRSNRRAVRASYGEILSGIVKSAKTGAIAHVAPRYAHLFQSYINDLEAAGAAIYYMGGYRPGPCSDRHMHPCGKALDVCQDYRGHVSGARDCHLPRPEEMARIAARNGLFEGSLWCSTDYGHAQVGESAAPCPNRNYAIGSWGKGHYLATMTGEIKTVSARRHYHHHRIRYARR